MRSRRSRKTVGMCYTCDVGHTHQTLFANSPLNSVKALPAVPGAERENPNTHPLSPTPSPGTCLKASPQLRQPQAAAREMFHCKYRTIAVFIYY